MGKQIVLALVIGLMMCPLMIYLNVGLVAGSGLGVNPRLYVGNGGPTTVQINPTDDVIVDEDDPDTNQESVCPLELNSYKWPGEPGTRSFLKFDLSSIPADAQIQSATLNLLCVEYNDASAEARAVTNDAWSEDTITWNNQPPYGDLLDTITKEGEAWPIHEWWEWNVTTWVSSELSGDKTASFCLKAAGACYFYSKEHGTDIPYLEVTYTTPEPGKDPTTLTVSPASFTLASGQGTTLTATLTSDGSPLAGKTITWGEADNRGTFSSTSDNTNSQGQVLVTYTAPTVENQTLVTVTASFAGDNQYESSSENSSGTITVAVDNDGDGMPDNWETQHGLNPNDSNDADDDPDDDNLTNLEEYQKGTDPNDLDTDDDEMPDGWEAANSLDPLADDAADDPDGDSYTNLQEYQAGTDPNLASSYPGAPEGEEGEGGQAESEFPYLALVVVVVIAIGLAGALLWFRAHRVGEELEAEWEIEASPNAWVKLKLSEPDSQVRR